MFSKTMTIHMKSGSAIEIKGVKSHKITRDHCGNIIDINISFARLSFTHDPIPHIDLSQIEAILVK